MQIDVGGLKVKVDTVGSGPSVVLFVHGLGASTACWDEAPDYFDPQRYRLVLPDLPGFGDSDKPTDYDYSMASLAEALERLLLQLDATNVHIVAHSMGCAVALLLVGRGAISPLSFAAAEGNLVAEDAFMSSKIARLSERAFDRMFSKWVNLAAESLGPEPVRLHEVFLRSLRASPPYALHRTSVSCMALTQSGELARRFATLPCPRLYLVGEKTLQNRELPDPVVTESVDVVTIPGRGHFLMDNAAAFYPQISRWMEQLAA